MSYIAPTAEVGPNAEVGDDAWVGGNARVGGHSQVGGNSRVGGHSQVGGNSRVGDNARVGGHSRVGDHSQVGGDTWVDGNAQIGDYADLQSTHHYLTLGPIGTERRYVTLSRQRPTSGRWQHQIIAGCWSGTCDELADRIADPDTAWPDASDAERPTARREYEAALVLMRARVATWEAEPVTAEDIARWADPRYANPRYADLRGHAARRTAAMGADALDELTGGAR